MSKIISKLQPDANILEVIDSVESALGWFTEHSPPDLIFMDIQLADGLSFEIFNHIKITTPIIFTTAYDEYTLKAFKVNSIDYLLKPIKDTEVAKSLQKYHDLNTNAVQPDYQKLAAAIEESQHQRQKRIVVRYGQNIKAVGLKEAAYFYTQEKVVFMQTYQGSRYAIDYSLEELEKLLDKHSFFRINRQFIVSIDAIDKMYQYSKSRVKLILKPSVDLDIIVSTDRSGSFKKWLAG
jgi:two-component system LytT family response regulator